MLFICNWLSLQVLRVSIMLLLISLLFIIIVCWLISGVYRLLYKRRFIGLEKIVFGNLRIFIIFLGRNLKMKIGVEKECSVLRGIVLRMRCFYDHFNDFSFYIVGLSIYFGLLLEYFISSGINYFIRLNYISN